MKYYDEMQNFNVSLARADRLSLISKISWRYKKGYGLRGDKYDLTANEVALMAMLYWYPEMDTANLLRRELGITKGMISRYVDGLLKRGLLESAQDETDRRVIRLRLSARAVEICKDVTLFGTKIVEEIFSNIEPENLRIMIETLDRIHTNISDLSDA